MNYLRTGYFNFSINSGHNSISGGHNSINSGHNSISGGQKSINGGQNSINCKIAKFVCSKFVKFADCKTGLVLTYL